MQVGAAAHAGQVTAAPELVRHGNGIGRLPRGAQGLYRLVDELVRGPEEVGTRHPVRCPAEHQAAERGTLGVEVVRGSAHAARSRRAAGHRLAGCQYSMAAMTAGSPSAAAARTSGHAARARVILSADCLLLGGVGAAGMRCRGARPDAGPPASRSGGWRITAP